MSEIQKRVLLSAPSFGTGKETLDECTGYKCGCCHGNGWFLDPEIIHECVKKRCPSCGGTGKVKAIVNVEWVPDGEVKPYFREP